MTGDSLLTRVRSQDLGRCGRVTSLGSRFLQLALMLYVINSAMILVGRETVEPQKSRSTAGPDSNDAHTFLHIVRVDAL